MKNIITKTGLYVALAALTALSFTACEDEPDRFRLAEGKPVVHYVRPIKASAADSLLTGAYMGNGICIVGDNLRSVYQLDFNDITAVLNNSYITDHTILVNVPNEIPGEVSNTMYLITKDRDTVKFDFNVLVPAPTLSSMKNEYAAPGTNTFLYGDYFVTDPNVPLSVSIGNTKCDIVSFTKTAIEIKVPADAKENEPVTVSTIYGDVTSPFRWRDARGILFNFDTDDHPACHGWHNDLKVIEDETSLSGKYLLIGDADMNADGGWNDSAFSFEYWPGGWVDPTYSEAPRLTDYADFSNWEKMSLKFEMLVPAANPWMAASMQLIVGGVDKITGGDKNVVDLDGVTCAGANNTYFNNNELPRGLYTPWATTGSFDTGDEWITVTIPYSNFIYGFDGSIATGRLTASDFTSLTIFLVSGGTKGTDCHPIIKLDNIRAVPNK
jgi:hypothetical protein